MLSLSRRYFLSIQNAEEFFNTASLALMEFAKFEIRFPRSFHGFANVDKQCSTPLQARRILLRINEIVCSSRGNSVLSSPSFEVIIVNHSETDLDVFSVIFSFAQFSNLMNCIVKTRFS